MRFCARVVWLGSKIGGSRITINGNGEQCSPRLPGNGRRVADEGKDKKKGSMEKEDKERAPRGVV